MKKYLYVTFFLFLAFSFSQAQIIRCGTYELHKMRMQNDPQYRAYYENYGQQVQKWIDQGAQERNTSVQSIVTIPVVVHILWNTDAQNISDAQVHSQIDVLNQDYAGNNPDQSQIPPAFKAVYGNVQVNFCLASRTSTGDWTTGIERMQTSISSFSFGDYRIKYDTAGGLDAWDATKYLNIWVVNLTGGLLGYTQMPGGPAATDGTVILYTSFGKGFSSLLPQYNLGRTATHEIGHWLGLFHVWGDGSPGQCLTDYIADTPPQSVPTYGCPAYPLTDVCTSKAPGVMFMNYLDYSDDDCMHMFSADQVVVMRGVLNSTRSSILTSNGCTAAVGIAEINAGTFINLYPNPANDAVRIDFRLPSATVLNVTACDMLGKRLISSDVYKTGEQSINLNVSSLSTGLYTLVVNTDQGIIAKRFAVTH